MQHASFFRRLALPLLLLSVLALPLAGCGDKEPEQRKAFITFLDSKVINKPGINMTPLTSEEEKQLGDYAKQYKVILDFHSTMNKEMGEKLTSIMGMVNIKSLAQAVENRDAIAKANKSAAEVKKQVIDQLAKSDAARAALKQPDDLKAVYDKAYEKSVRRPATAFITAFEKVEGTLNSVLALIDFIKANKDGIDISGQMVQVKDAALQPELNAKLKAVQENTQALLKAYQELSAASR